MRVLAAVLIAGSIIAPAHAFDLDRPYPEVMAHFDQPTVRDLVIGDTGHLGFNALCEDGKRLHVVASAPVLKSDRQPMFVVTREAGGTVRMQLGDVLGWQGFMKHAIRPCHSVVSGHYSESDLTPVSTVNGYSSISAAMED